MKSIICSLVFALGLFSTGNCLAWYGGGGYHGGGGGWHGGYHGGGWNGGYYGGGYYDYHGGGWGWGGGAVVIGPGYSAPPPPPCQTIRVCNAYGHCWYQESCY